MVAQRNNVARLSEEERWTIISTWKQCGNMSQVARTLSKAWGTKLPFKRVKHWVDVYKRDGTVVANVRHGRQKLIDTTAAKVAVKLLVDSDNFGTAEAVATELHHMGLTKGPKPVSKSTLIRAAKAQASVDGDDLEVANGKPGNDISAATKQKRLDFATKHLNFNWAHVMFTDRKKFAFKYPGTKVKSKRWIQKSKGGKNGNKCWQPNNPLRVNLYMGITKFGVTKVHKVTGSHGMKSAYLNKKKQPARNITAHEYGDVVGTFLKEGKRIFTSQGCATFKLQQDNDPTHPKAAAQQIDAWNASRSGFRVELFQWPPHSPDLSPIENVWGIVQREVDALGCKNFKEFELAVIDKLQNFPLETLHNMYKGLGDRMKAVIEAKGDKIKH
jgi:hypothetical protein